MYTEGILVGIIVDAVGVNKKNRFIKNQKKYEKVIGHNSACGIQAGRSIELIEESKWENELFLSTQNLPFGFDIEKLKKVQVK